jgi:signal transduction histidine kinase
LVVEDEALVALDLQERLTRMGFEVSAVVDNGADALASVARAEVDLVLMDIHIRGDRDGIETAEALRRNAGVPVVYLTAHADEATLQRAGLTEPFGYVLKPFDERDLRAALHMALYRHRVELKLQEAQRLESLAVMATGVAHDFNNLLVGVTCNASLVRAMVPADSPLVPYLRQIEAAGQRAALLCGQMLDYAGQGQVDLKELDFNEVARETGRLLESSIGKHTKLVFDLAENLPPLKADASQLRQVVMNLVINASEALEDKPGTVTVRLSLFAADRAFLDACQIGAAMGAGNYLALEVSDTGHGIPREMMPRIFDPFFTTKFAGRGLGLAAVSGIIRKQQGALLVVSTPGEGASFRVLLPPIAVQAPLPSAAPAVAGVLAWRGSGRALLVDDDPALRLAAGAALRFLGFEVHTANDGAEGIEKATAPDADYRVVLLDLMMPNVDGHAAFQAIRAFHPDLPILLMSGYSDRQVAPLTDKGGPVAFMQKPFSVSSLAAELESLMQF